MSEKKSLQKELEELLNSHCQENVSNTPDFILAEYLLLCLQAFQAASIRRDQWYNVTLSPGRFSHVHDPHHYGNHL